MLKTVLKLANRHWIELIKQILETRKIKIMTSLLTRKTIKSMRIMKIKMIRLTRKTKNMKIKNTKMGLKISRCTV